MLISIMFTSAFLISFFSYSPAWAVDILYVGDSHSAGCFGEDMDVAIRKAGPSKSTNLQVLSYAACGSSTTHWLSDRGASSVCGFRSCSAEGKCSTKNVGQAPGSIQQIVKTSSPKTTIVQLGTNMIPRNIADKHRFALATKEAMQDVRRLIKEVQKHGGQCIWIGPPQAGTRFVSADWFEDFVNTLQTTVEQENCRFIDSSTKTSRDNLSSRDPLHYPCGWARDWAKQTMRELSPLLLFPSTEESQRPVRHAR